MLTYSSEINVDFSLLANASNSLDNVRGPIERVRGYIEKQLLQSRQDCVTFVACAFPEQTSLAHTPLPDFPFEGYIQTRSAIDLYRLQQWLQDAKWTNVGENGARALRTNSFVLPIAVL